MRARLIFTGLLMLIVFFCMLSGCEEIKDDFADSVTQTDNLSQAVLTFYMFGEEKKDTKEVLGKVAAASNLNITLDFEWSGGEGYYHYYDTVKAAMAANEAMDAFICGKAVPDRMNTADLFRNGEIKDITELLPKYAPVIAGRLSAGDRAAASVDGRMVAVPPLVNMTESISAFIRQDLAEKYGITAINTYDEYETFLKRVKENEKEILPCFISGGNLCDIDLFARAYNYVVLDYMQFLVYKWDDPQMKIIPWEQTPEFRDSISMISRWWKKGYIELYNGSKRKLASFIGRTGNFSEDTREIDFFNDGDKRMYNAYILFKDKRFQRKGSMDQEISSFAFNSNSINTERVLMFLNWIQSSQENYDLFMYGIKGRHYVLKGERIGMPEGIQEDNNLYSGWYNIPFLNIDYIRRSVDDPSSGDSTIKEREFLEKYTAYSPLTGFYPDYTEVKDICDKRTRIYLGRVEDALNRGSIDPDETNDSIEELKNIGTGEIVADVQRQLEKWKSLK